MIAFTKLYLELDASTTSEDKVNALATYFHMTTPDDAAWAIQLCMGKIFKTSIKIKELQTWCLEVSGIPEWLFAESLLLVGDLSETIALLAGETEGNFDMPLHSLIEAHILAFRNLNIEARKKTIVNLWKQMDCDMRIILNKIVTGSLRINIPDHVLAMALSKISGVPQPQILWRLQSAFITNAEQFLSLIQPDPAEALATQPYPFCLARDIQTDIENLGKKDEWTAEWAWGGIRAQLIYRKAASFIWTEDGEILNTYFPEIVLALQALPDYCVLDVKILGWKKDLLPQNLLQKRLARKTSDKKIREEVPALAMIFDVLEYQGEDIRHLPLNERSIILDKLPVSEGLQVSPELYANTWQDLEIFQQEARVRNRAGLLLRKKDSQYTDSSKTIDWYTWERPSLRMKAVLIYAQRAQGIGVGQYAQYTFGIWHKDLLVSIAKTDSCLNEADRQEINAFIQANKLEKFGPVVTLQPKRVYEIEFDAVYTSTRHKSGLTVQSPRMIRYLPNARPEDADTIEMLTHLL